MQVQDYSEKSIVVFGEKTREYKEDLKALGAKFNMKLSVGPGWVLPKTKKEEVDNLIESIQNENVEKPKIKVSYKTKDVVENMKMNDYDDPSQLLKMANSKMDKIISLLEDFQMIKKKLNELNIQKGTSKTEVEKKEKDIEEEGGEYQYEEEVVQDVKRFKL